MARHESDREDLMREATALVHRAELVCPGETELVIAGFHRDGRLSLYFGPDPVFQFDSQHRLRRAYARGFLYRTQGETLARLARQRTQEQTLLVRHDLEPAELDTFRTDAKTRLERLQKGLVQSEVQVVAQVPAEDNLLPDLEQALTSILNRDLPLAPRIPGKR